MADDLRAGRVSDLGAALLQREGEADDRREGRAKLVRDRGEDVVAQVVQALSFGDVLGRPEHARRRTRPVDDNAPACVKPTHVTIGEHDPMLERKGLSVVGPGLDRLLQPPPIVGIYALQERFEGHFERSWRESEQAVELVRPRHAVRSLAAPT